MKHDSEPIPILPPDSFVGPLPRESWIFAAVGAGLVALAFLAATLI